MACVEAPSVHADGLSGLRRKRARARALNDLRACTDRALWTIRWHLKQRRPRPPHGDRLIDYIAPAMQGILCATAIIFTIGG